MSVNEEAVERTKRLLRAERVADLAERLMCSPLGATLAHGAAAHDVSIAGAIYAIAGAMQAQREALMAEASK